MADNGKTGEDEFADVMKALTPRALRAMQSPLGHMGRPPKDVFIDSPVKKSKIVVGLIRTSLLITLNLATEKPIWVASGTFHEPRGKRRPMKPKGKAHGAMILQTGSLLDEIGKLNVVQHDQHGGMSVQCFKNLGDRERELFDTLHPDWIEDELGKRADACRYCGCSLVDKESPILHPDICMDCAEREGVK